jgi:cobalt/nickel transport system permease protein
VYATTHDNFVNFHFLSDNIPRNHESNRMIWAVHISDGILAPWVAIVAGLVAWGGIVFASRRLSEGDIPRMGVLTALFFIGSQLHIPIAGVSSAHLLLNGVIGVILGWRAVVVVALGLVLQMMLFGHGGWTTLGVNVLLYTLPMLAIRPTILRLRTRQVFHWRKMRAALAFLASLVLLATVVLISQWIWSKIVLRESFPREFQSIWMSDPYLLSILGLVSLGLAFIEPRIETDPDFPLGLLLGGMTAYVTVLLNVGTLLLFAKDTLPDLAGLVMLANLPVIAVEALMTGFITAYLGRAKPEWLR